MFAVDGRGLTAQRRQPDHPISAVTVIGQVEQRFNLSPRRPHGEYGRIAHRRNKRQPCGDCGRRSVALWSRGFFWPNTSVELLVGW